jgi:hypothetical protein
MSTTPAAALEFLLGLPPLQLVVEKEVRQSALLRSFREIALGILCHLQKNGGRVSGLTGFI